MSTAEPSKALPPPSADTVMTSTGSTAGQETAVDAEGPQPANDSGTGENADIQPYTPDQKKSEVLRILQWPSWALYEILEVPETATMDRIKSAFRKKSLLTHTDQNGDNDAKEVFQRVTNAKDILMDQTKRREYDKIRAGHKSRGELVQNDLGEDFAQNAYDGRERDDNDDDDDDDDDGDKPEPMSREKEQKLKQMEPFVKRALDSDDDEEAYKQLEQLDKEMRKLNKKENKGRAREQVPPIRITDRTPPIIPIRHASKKRREQLAILESNRDTKAKEDAIRELKRLQKDLMELLRELHLPASWAYDVPDTAAPSAASQRSSAGNRRTSNPSAAAGRSTDQPSFDPMDTADDWTPGQTTRGEENAGNRQTGNPPTAAGRSAGQSLFDAMDTTDDWTPGQTTRGEEILAFRPITMTGTMVSTGEIGQLYSSIRFVIKTEGGRNPIKIVDEARVGSPAVKAYLGLPQERKCNLTKVDRQYGRLDDYKFGSIKGVARDPYATVDRKLAWTVVLVEYDGEPRLVNRTALRNAKKERIADGMVNDFLISVGEEPDTPKNVRRLEQANNRLLLEQHDSGGRLGSRSTRFRTGSPLMLPAEEDPYYDFDAPSFPRASRARMPADSVHLRSRDSRRDRFGDQERDAALDTPRESYRPTSARPQGPTPVRTAPPVQLASRTNTTDAPPDMIRDEQRRTGAAAGEQPVTQAQFLSLMNLVQQLTVGRGSTQVGGTGVYGS